MNRKWVWPAGLAIAALVGIGVALSRSDSAGSPQAGPSCRLAPPAVAAAGDTSGVQVVETGYSKLGTNASMGALIRNETGKVAYRTLVTFDALDSAGRTVVADHAHIWQSQVVPVLRPGDSAAVGVSVALAQNSDRDLKSISSIRVTLKTGQWLDPGDGNTGLGPVTAAVIDGSGKREEDGQGTLRFSTESANCATTRHNQQAGMASRGVSMVFRDASGVILGGTLDISPRHDTCLPVSALSEN